MQPHDWQEGAISAKEKRLPADRSARLIKMVPDRGRNLDDEWSWTRFCPGPPA